MSEHLALFHVADLNILLFVQTRDYVLILRKLGLWLINSKTFLLFNLLWPSYWLLSQAAVYYIN